ncbi:predicted protein [Sclerotinia sclerotiorum 1980 UF-70]|uniref:Uncharacterized protein n=1 Tax=Sclerotinia sclerotiorum (strain ATCC 18683 / 1980 / Ss-1) TaxID=665079 RepID=A7EBZ5_SCLS1|nr:predicted protein [Sclerotinia sclerotiorum 1980 UF-70]XP_001596611.1 predicted protein [Sclerotinia sclerotiorum 1980 UF-70]EDN92163.1 predicted protein [Sclerotinia sclerotiorum 1980 UF-70]EDN99973.1 predicted protein [Sclerotinia sclerotiorum 1980 UF-70]
MCHVAEQKTLLNSDISPLRKMRWSKPPSPRRALQPTLDVPVYGTIIMALKTRGGTE